MVVARVSVDELDQGPVQREYARRSRGRRHTAYGEQASGYNAASRVRRRNQEISNGHLTRGFGSKVFNTGFGASTVQVCALWQAAQSCVVIK